MQKPPVHAPVSARPFSCTAGRALIRSWATTGRGALRWVCTRLSLAFGGSATCDARSSIPPPPRLSLSHPWRSRRCPYRPVQSSSSRSFAARGGALRSDRVASRGAVARPLSSAPATLWQWGTPVARDGSQRRRWPPYPHDTRQVTGHTAIITLHSPLHPPCSARSRPGTVGVICVTDCCESSV